MTAGRSTMLESVIDALRGVKGPDRAGWWTAHCPLHVDRKPSLRFTSTGFECMGCGEKGHIALLAAKLGVAEEKHRPFDARVQATYDYVDEDGRLLFQSVRLRDPKDFRQRRPDGSGGWIWNLNGVRRALYRLPEVLSAAADEALFVVEGEKDANRLWAEGLPATTNAGGAGKWLSEYSESLRGSTAVIIPDNDDAGRGHAEQVARSGDGVAAEVRVLTLPNLPEKGDVSDWFDAGGTAAELLQLAAETAVFVPDCDGQGDASVTGTGQQPTIVVSDRHLHDIAADGWLALQRANVPVRSFVHGLDVAEVVRDAGGRCSIKHMGVAALRGRLDRCADWQREAKGGLAPARPPKDVVEDMLALEKPLPPLKGIVGTPMFADDGSLDCTPGYQPTTHLYYEPTGEAIPAVPPTPDATDLMRAKAYLRQEWLADFPFLDDASFAHAVSIALTVMAREMIHGPTPLFAVDAPAPGSGKGLLCSSVGIIVSGREAAVMTETRGEEERKRITALVRAGHPLLLLDNVKRKLESGTFAAMLTAPFWSDRILGATQDVELPVRGVWMATGNNLQFDSDISRRVVWIRIDARVDRPWERSEFRKGNLLEWVGRHRHELVWSCLVLIQNWIAAGRPLWQGRPLGSFESWCNVIGGVLEAAGIAGFLENRGELYSRADAETEEWRTFVRQWQAAFGDTPIKAAEVLSIAKELLPSVFERVRDNASDRALLTRLGIALKQRVDRSFDGLFIRRAGADHHDGGTLWRLDCGTFNGSDASASAEVPQDKWSTPDTFAEAAEPAEPVLGVDATFDDQPPTEHGVFPTPKKHPQVPQLPHVDSNSTDFGAEPLRKVDVSTTKVPQERPRCGRCRMPMSVARVDDVCGLCKQVAR